MRRLPTSVRRAVLLRSLAVQGSWNYRTLVGAGFAFALRPALRAIYTDPAAADAAERRHVGLFNCHPYLSPMALGAVASMEAAGDDPALIERFKAAIRGSLGTLGDRIVWAGWRPVCLLFGIALLLMGAPWWLAVGAFLLAYNVVHFAIRLWSFRLGIDEGRRVAERLRQVPIADAQRFLSAAGAFLVGVVIPLAASGALVHARVEWIWVVAALVAAGIGTRFGSRTRMPVVMLLVAATLIGIVIEAIA